MSGANGNGGIGGHVPDEPTRSASTTILDPDVVRIARGPASERDEAAAIILGDDRGAAILRNIRERASDRKLRNAQWANLAADIAGWTGKKEQIIAYVVAQIGASVMEARDAVKRFESVPSDAHAIYAECRKFCDWYEGPEGPGGEQ